MKNNKSDWKKDTLRYYDKLLDKHGVSPRATDQRDWEQMKLGFKVLCEIAELHDGSVADIGSGFSDLYLYLKEIGWKGKYTGFEMNKRFADAARERFPEVEIIEGEFLSIPVSKKFDWVFLNGTLNLAFDGIEQFTYNVIKKMYETCNHGVTFNLATSYVDYKEGILYHYEPEKIFKYCKSLTKYVTLRHDYPIWAFTMYLYRRA